MSNIFPLEQDPELMKTLVGQKNRNRADFHQDILVSLGAPTIKVELTTEQLDQSINSALRQFWTHHRDGSFENFYFVQLTEEQVAQGWIKIPETIDSIVEVLPQGFGGGDANFANAEWQLAAAALPGASGSSAIAGSSFSIGTPGASAGVGGAFGGVSKISRGAVNAFSFGDYQMARQAIDIARMMTGTNNKFFNFSRYQRRLYPRFNVKVGDFLAFRCYENLDPDRNPELCGELFDDETIKNLAVAYAMVIWGMVLRKFGGIALPGGVTLDGDQLVQEGTETAEKIVEDMKNSQPTDFFIG